jgi:4-amino-4-deoxy-L-arabinose transferase-like glycosyltransferase
LIAQIEERADSTQKNQRLWAEPWVSEAPARPNSAVRSDIAANTTGKTLSRIFLLGLAIRLIVSFLAVGGVIGDVTDPRLDHWRFGWETGRVARSLASGHGFSDPLVEPSGPTAWLAPVYPLVLAGIFKVFGIYSAASAAAILAFNSAISALTCLPVFLIAQKISGKRVATWTAFIWAVFPYSVYVASTIVWDSCLNAFILACLVWLTLEMNEGKAMRSCLGYGALWGLGALTNPTMLVALPLLLGWLYFRQRRSARISLRTTGVIILMCFAVMSPWLARNYVVFHQLVPVKSNLWLEFTVGNSTEQSHWWNDEAHPSRNPLEMRALAQTGEIAYMAEKKIQAVDFIQRHLAIYLWLCLRRFIYVWFGFWSLNPNYLAQEPADLVNVVFCSAVSIAALFGFGRAFRLSNNSVVPMATVVLAVPFVYYLTHPFPFYRHVVDPEVVILAAYGVVPHFIAHLAARRTNLGTRKYALQES